MDNHVAAFIFTAAVTYIIIQILINACMPKKRRRRRH